VPQAARRRCAWRGPRRNRKARKAGEAAPEVAAAEALLKKLADSIVDDWTAYTQGGEVFSVDGFDTLDAARTAELGNFNSVRRARGEERL